MPAPALLRRCVCLPPCDWLALQRLARQLGAAEDRPVTAGQLVRRAVAELLARD